MQPQNNTRLNKAEFSNSKPIKKSSKKTLTANQRAFSKSDIRKELIKLELQLETLKLDYEQYFLGNVIIRPDKAQHEVKLLIRAIRKIPFKKPWMRFKLRALEARYNIYNDYWQRTIKQKEEGTYQKDVFKAELKERTRQAELKAATKAGKAVQQVQALFECYRRELEKQCGHKVNIEFSKFQKSIQAQAKAFKAKHAGKKLAFKVVVNNGKVAIKASVGG